MNLKEYMRACEATWARHDYPQLEVPHAVLGLAEETGEVVGLFKKGIRGDGPVSEEKLIKELGDVAYYWVTLCRLMNISPDEVLRTNVAKIQSRKERGVTKGSGDDR